MPILDIYSTIFSKFLRSLLRPAVRQSTEEPSKKLKSTSGPNPSSTSSEKSENTQKRSSFLRHQLTTMEDSALLITLLELTPEDLVHLFQNLEPEEISKILRRIYVESSSRTKGRS